MTACAARVEESLAADNCELALLALVTGGVSRIGARAVAAEVTRRKCFRVENPPPHAATILEHTPAPRRAQARLDPFFSRSCSAGGQFVPRWAGAWRTGGQACLKFSASETSRPVPPPRLPESPERGATLRGRRSCAHGWRSAHRRRQRGIRAAARTNKRR